MTLICWLGAVRLCSTSGPNSIFFAMAALSFSLLVLSRVIHCSFSWNQCFFICCLQNTLFLRIWFRYWLPFGLLFSTNIWNWMFSSSDRKTEEYTNLWPFIAQSNNRYLSSPLFTICCLIVISQTKIWHQPIRCPEACKNFWPKLR